MLTSRGQALLSQRANGIWPLRFPFSIPGYIVREGSFTLWIDITRIHFIWSHSHILLLLFQGQGWSICFLFLLSLLPIWYVPLPLLYLPLLSMGDGQVRPHPLCITTTEANDLSLGLWSALPNAPWKLLQRCFLPLWKRLGRHWPPVSHSPSVPHRLCFAA